MTPGRVSVLRKATQWDHRSGAGFKERILISYMLCPVLMAMVSCFSTVELR